MKKMMIWNVCFAHFENVHQFTEYKKLLSTTNKPPALIVFSWCNKESKNWSTYLREIFLSQSALLRNLENICYRSLKIERILIQCGCVYNLSSVVQFFLQLICWWKREYQICDVETASCHKDMYGVHAWIPKIHWMWTKKINHQEDL